MRIDDELRVLPELDFANKVLVVLRVHQLVKRAAEGRVSGAARSAWPRMYIDGVIPLRRTRGRNRVIDTVEESARIFAERLCGAPPEDLAYSTAEARLNHIDPIKVKCVDFALNRWLGGGLVADVEVKRVLHKSRIMSCQFALNAEINGRAPLDVDGTTAMFALDLLQSFAKRGVYPPPPDAVSADVKRIGIEVLGVNAAGLELPPGGAGLYL